MNEYFGFASGLLRTSGLSAGLFDLEESSLPPSWKVLMIWKRGSWSSESLSS
jgi:hypothetical protein